VACACLLHPKGQDVTDIVGELVAGNKAAIALATEEYLEIHRICDGTQVVRTRLGERLSAAQRVKELSDLYIDAMGRLMRDAGALEG
jgi:hypothetical protein